LALTLFTSGEPGGWGLTNRGSSSSSFTRALVFLGLDRDKVIISKGLLEELQNALYSKINQQYEV